MKRLIAVVFVASMLMGCEDPKKKQIQTINEDAELMGRAQAAVNEVIRNAPDCEVARPLLDEAYQRLEEAQGRVRLAASRQTLAMMKIQVDRVAQACP